MKSLYEDKCSGKIPENIFFSLVSEFTQEQAELEEKLPQLKSQIEAAQGTEQEIEGWLSLISRYTNIETLDRTTVMELIEAITVSDGVKVGSKRTQEIKIQYRFVGNLSPKNENEDIA